MCGSSSNASPWSIVSSMTCAASSMGWCINSPRRHRRTTPARRKGHRRRNRPMRPFCCRCPASAPRCSPRYLPRVTTQYGGVTTMHFAASAEWLRLLDVRARVCSRHNASGLRPVARRGLPLGPDRRPTRSDSELSPRRGPGRSHARRASGQPCRSAAKTIGAACSFRCRCAAASSRARVARTASDAAVRQDIIPGVFGFPATAPVRPPREWRAG